MWLRDADSEVRRVGDEQCVHPFDEWWRGLVRRHLDTGPGLGWQVDSDPQNHFAVDIDSVEAVVLWWCCAD